MEIKLYDYQGRQTEATSSTVMFVRHMDYAALLAEVQQLRSERDALRTGGLSAPSRKSACSTKS